MGSGIPMIAVQRIERAAFISLFGIRFQGSNTRDYTMQSITTAEQPMAVIWLHVFRPVDETTKPMLARRALRIIPAPLRMPSHAGSVWSAPLIHILLMSSLCPDVNVVIQGVELWSRYWVADKSASKLHRSEIRR